MNKPPAILGTYNQIKIVFTDRLINLTQMHKAVDGRMSQRPVHFLALTTTVKFLKTLMNKHGVEKSHVITTIKGRGKPQHSAKS